jgi:hypothetical protein
VIRRSLLVVLALLALSCSGDDTSKDSTARSTTSTAAPTAYAGYRSAMYDRDASWLCRPDSDDACDSDLDAQVIEADGSSTVERFRPATDAKVDCFYVYPTISRDPTANSDMHPGAEEEGLVVRQQAARFGSVCKLYAPVYRSATLTALVARMTGKPVAGAEDSRAIAYGDVLDAWKQYIAHDNHGRGVILIGHSQGAGILGRLLEEEIDPSPALRKLLVSAMVMGTSAHASDTPHIPPCDARVRTGCVVSYSTFRSTAPPPATSFFARPKGAETAICTNPAAIDGGSAELHPYFATAGASLLGGSAPPDWGVPVTKRFVSVPGLVTGECVVRNGFSYLELTVHPDPGPRVDDVRGDLTPEWGMHLIDVNVALGDLVALAGAQATAYAR